MVAQEKKHYRILKKKGRTLVTDIDGNVVPLWEAQQMAKEIMETAQSKTFVYLGYREDDGLFKIGRTGNLEQRETALGIEFVHTIECAIYGGYGSNVIETALHKVFKMMGFHIDGEWFNFPEEGIYVLKALVGTTAKEAMEFCAFAEKAWPDMDREYAEKGTPVFAKWYAGIIQSGMTMGHINQLIMFLTYAQYCQAMKDDEKIRAAYLKGIIDFSSAIFDTWPIVEEKRATVPKSEPPAQLPFGPRPNVPVRPAGKSFGSPRHAQGDD